MPYAVAAPAPWPARVREAPDPADELFSLGERCAERFMQADALRYEALCLLAEFDRRRGWEGTAFGSTAEWLAWRIGITIGPAREQVRTALALTDLPETSAAMRNGELSYSKVRAITRVAKPETEADLLELARSGSAAQLERVVRGWRALDRDSEITAEERRFRSRRLSAWVAEDGMVVVKGRLDPEAGAVLLRAIEAANDALYAADTEPDATEPEQRRADALGLVAERALAAGFAGGSGSRAARYQVMLHVDESTLREDGEPGRSELGDGTRVSAETSRRLTCDAAVVRMTSDEPGQFRQVGHRSRTVPSALRRALEARDRGCRYPGCGSRYHEVHHIQHWADGGEHSARNTVLLCRRHHRLVHEGRGRVCKDVHGRVAFFTRDGRVLGDAPPPRPADRPMASPPLLLDERARERMPVHRTGGARWHRDADIPWDILARAMEAAD